MVRNTDPEPAVPDASDALVESLCLALRDVGVREVSLPEDAHAVAHVRRLQTLHDAILARGIDISDRIEALSAETGWDMSELLEQCLRYPEVMPEVRESDGVRRQFRCPGCMQRERPSDDDRFFLCNDCLVVVRNALRTMRPIPRLFLFRSYSPDARCPHPSEDTPLAVYPWPWKTTLVSTAASVFAALSKNKHVEHRPANSCSRRAAPARRGSKHL